MRRIGPPAILQSKFKCTHACTIKIQAGDVGSKIKFQCTHAHLPFRAYESHTSKPNQKEESMHHWKQFALPLVFFMTIHAELSRLLGASLKPVSSAGQNAHQRPTASLSTLLGTTVKVASPVFEAMSDSQHLSAPTSPCPKKKTPDSLNTPASPHTKKRKTDDCYQFVQADFPSPGKTVFNVSTKQKKRTEAARSVIYTSEDYVSKLLCSKALDVYDNKYRPICHGSCKFKCQATFRQAPDGPKFLKDELQKWWGPSISKCDRRTMLADDIMRHTGTVAGGKPQTQYFVGDKQVCRNFYLRARGMHHETLRLLEKELLVEKRSMLSIALDTRKQQKQSSTRYANIKVWLQDYAAKMGEKSSMDTETVLPYRNIKPMYEHYKFAFFQADSLLQDKPKPVSKSHFHRIFVKASLELHIRLARGCGDFLKCKVCDAYDARIRQACSDQQRKILKKYKTRHLGKQQKQREKFYKHRQKARDNRKRYLSIIIDGMDQKKTDCPVMGSKIKDESPLVQRVIGAKVHGIRTYAFLCDETVPHGGNIICEVLRRVLKDLEERSELPYINPVLYLQIDNCGENKNKTLFAFLTDLVRKNVFNKIKACFLMVGHTHEDIDQVFATIAGHLKQLHIVCPDRESLMAAIRDAFQKEKDKPTIHTIYAPEVPDYTAFYKHFIDKTISQHQKPHQFRVKRFVDGSQEIVLVHYKSWAESQLWLPKHGMTDPIIPNSASKEVPKPAATSTQKMIKKEPKGQLTAGQRAEITRRRLARTKSMPSRCVSDIHENLGYHTNDEQEDLEQSSISLQKSTQDHCLRGIQWLTADTSFDSFPLVTFTPEQVGNNYCKVQKIYNDICSKFSTTYHGIFSADVMSNWFSWLEREKMRWDLNSKCNTHIALSIPVPFEQRQPAVDCDDMDIVVDSAPMEFDDSVEYLTHASGKYGTLKKAEQRQAFASLGANLSVPLRGEDTADPCEIIQGMFCLYKYVFPNLVKKTEMEQIGLGKIVEVHGDPTKADCLFDIQFCPPKGAKAQTSKRPDTLYQDITASMEFNLHYKKKTKSSSLKTLDIDKGLPKDVLLAWNLDVTTAGKLGSIPCVGDEAQGMTSLQFADRVIKEYYYKNK